MPCKDCLIFHDGVLKGECRCALCDCYFVYRWNKNWEINNPITKIINGDEELK